MLVEAVVLLGRERALSTIPRLRARVDKVLAHEVALVFFTFLLWVSRIFSTCTVFLLRASRFSFACNVRFASFARFLHRFRSFLSHGSHVFLARFASFALAGFAHFFRALRAFRTLAGFTRFVCFAGTCFPLLRVLRCRSSNNQKLRRFLSLPSHCSLDGDSPHAAISRK